MIPQPDDAFTNDIAAYLDGYRAGKKKMESTVAPGVVPGLIDDERPPPRKGIGGPWSIWAALIVAAGLVAGGWLARSPAPHTTTQTVDQVVDMGEYVEDPAKAAQRSRLDQPETDSQPVDTPVQDDPAPSTPQPDAAAEPVAVQPEAPPTSEPAPAPDPQPDPTTPPPAPEPPPEAEPPQEEPAEDDGLLTPVVELVDGVLEIVGLGGGGS